MLRDRKISWNIKSSKGDSNPQICP